MGNESPAMVNAAVAAAARRDGMQLTNTSNGTGQQVGIPSNGFGQVGMQGQPQRNNRHRQQQSQYPMQGFQQQQQQQQYPIQQSQQMVPQMNPSMMGSGFGGGVVNNGNGWNGQQNMMNSMGGNEWSNEFVVGGTNRPTVQNNAMMNQQPVSPSSSINSQQFAQGTMNGQGGPTVNGSMNYNNNQMMYPTPTTSFNQQQPHFPQQQQHQQNKARELLSQAQYSSVGGNKVNLSYLKMQTKNNQQFAQGTMNGQNGLTMNGMNNNMNGMNGSMNGSMNGNMNSGMNYNNNQMMYPATAFNQQQQQQPQFQPQGSVNYNGNLTTRC